MSNFSMSMAFNFLDKANIPKEQEILDAMQKRMNRVGIEAITVERVDVDIDGEITVTYSDEEGDEMDIIFFYDQEDGAIALIADEEDDENWLIVDLDALNPPIVNTGVGKFIQMSSLEWMNKSAFQTLFQAGDVDDADDNQLSDNELGKGRVLPDPYGYIGEDLLEDDEVILEARKVYVVRGGKKVKLAIVRKVRRKILTGRQKGAIRKAVRKRKAQKHKIARKRKKALRVRKRMKIKTPTNLGRNQKVAGTANRKR